MSRTSHHRGQKANQCKDLWGKRGDMGTGSHYSKYNRTLAGRKERRKSITEIDENTRPEEAYDNHLMEPFSRQSTGHEVAKRIYKTMLSESPKP